MHKYMDQVLPIYEDWIKMKNEQARAKSETYWLTLKEPDKRKIFLSECLCDYLTESNNRSFLMGQYYKLYLTSVCYSCQSTLYTSDERMFIAATNTLRAWLELSFNELPKSIIRKDVIIKSSIDKSFMINKEMVIDLIKWMSG